MPAAAPNPYFRPVIRRQAYRETVLADNPTYYWRLGESSGGSVVDEMNAKAFAYQGVPLFNVPGLINDPNTSVNFNSTGYASNNSTFGSFTLPITFEFWTVVPSNHSQWVPVFVSHDHGSNYYGFIVQTGIGDIIAWQWGNGGLNGPTSRKTTFTTNAVPTDVPIHVVIVSTSITDVTIYVNGVVQATSQSGTASTISYTTGTPKIAYSILPGFVSPYYDSILDEIALYDGIALTAQQVLNHYNAGVKSGMVASYTGAYNSLLHLDNSYTNPNPNVTWNTYSGTVAFDAAEKVFGSHSARFDGPVSGGEVIRCATINYLPALWTAECRVKVNAFTAGSDVLFGCFNTSGYGMYFGVNVSNQFGLAGTTTGSSWTISIATSVTVSLGTWYHVAVSYDGTTYRIYIDGLLKGSGVAGSMSAVNFNNGFSIGGFMGSGGNTDHVSDSWIDEFRFMNVALYTSNFALSPTAYPDDGIYNV